MDDARERRETCRRLREARSVAVLTGAGVSAESGVPTFRGPGGLWKGRDPMSLATPEAFRADPKTVWEWYDWRRAAVSAARPNPAHEAIARMDSLPRDFLLITQNVDGLHALAGSRRLVEIHGNIWRLRCIRDGAAVEDRRVPLDPLPPVCACGALQRPDVVWFGEALPSEALARAVRQCGQCDVMLVVGTSALVQPAASFPLAAREAGAWIVEINTEPTPLTPYADDARQGSAAAILPELAGEMARGGSR